MIFWPTQGQAEGGQAVTKRPGGLQGGTLRAVRGCRALQLLATLLGDEVPTGERARISASQRGSWGSRLWEEGLPQGPAKGGRVTGCGLLALEDGGRLTAACTFPAERVTPGLLCPGEGGER